MNEAHGATPKQLRAKGRGDLADRLVEHMKRHSKLQGAIRAAMRKVADQARNDWEGFQRTQDKNIGLDRLSRNMRRGFGSRRPPIKGDEALSKACRSVLLVKAWMSAKT